MLKIKRGDKVIVNVGKDKNKKGIVLKILKDKSFCYNNSYNIIVEGINICKKHMKGNPAKGKVSGIVERECPINYSNVSIFNDITGKRDKVCFKFLNDKKIRIYKSTKEVVKNG